jgi:hypothetical protein
MKILIVALASTVLFSNAYAEDGPLKGFGAPKGFQFASKEIVDGLRMKDSYVFEIDEGELSEVLVMQSRSGFEKASAKIFDWLKKYDFKLIEGECHSSQNQQCEFVAKSSAGSVRLNLASARPKQDFLLLIATMVSSK